MAGSDEEMADFIRTARRLAAERKKRIRQRSSGVRSADTASGLRGFGRAANSDAVEKDQGNVAMHVAGKRTA